MSSDEGRTSHIPRQKEAPLDMLVVVLWVLLLLLTGWLSVYGSLTEDSSVFPPTALDQSALGKRVLRKGDPLIQ